MNKEVGQKNVEEVIAQYQPQLKAFIRKRVSNKDDADDILQDVFYQFVKAIENTLNPIEQVAAWLYRVTRNTIINKSRKKREEELPSYKDEEGNDIFDDFSEVLFGSDNSPEMEYMRSLVWDELEQALSELPLEQREAFELMELNGLPVKEVSEASGVSVNTLLSRKHYAVKFLRKRLEKLYKDILYY